MALVSARRAAELNHGPDSHVGSYDPRPRRATGLKSSDTASVIDRVIHLPPRRTTSREGAFTLMEVLIVMAILAILSSIGIWSVRSSQATGRVLAATAAAHAYGNAVDEFARDHGGRYPATVGSADWSTRPERGPVAAQLGGEEHPYLRRVPEPMQDGTLSFSSRGPARLDYRQTSGGRGFEILVSVAGRAPCAVRGGDARGITPPTCAQR